MLPEKKSREDLTRAVIKDGRTQPQEVAVFGKDLAIKKDHKGERAFRRRLRFGIASLVIIFLFGSFLNFIFRVQHFGTNLNFITRPFLSKHFNKSSLSSTYRNNILFISQTEGTKAVRLLSYEPVEKELTMIDVPIDSYLNLPGRAVFLLKGYQPEESNYDEILLQIQDLFALPLDAVIVSHDPNLTLTEDQIQQLRQSTQFSINKIPLALDFFQNKAQTNLSSWDCITLLGYLRSLRADKISTYTLEGYDFELKVDKRTYKALDLVKVDGLIRKVVPERAILKQPVAVEIRNATEVSGLGNQLNRYLTNLGAQVIFVGNTPALAKKSAFYEFEERKVLNDRLGFLKVGVQKADRENFNLDTRADLLLVIGQDYLDTFYPKEE